MLGQTENNEQVFNTLEDQMKSLTEEALMADRQQSDTITDLQRETN